MFFLKMFYKVNALNWANVMMSFKFDVHNFLQMDVFFWEEKT